MEGATITADLTVTEVLERWPQTISVFHRYRTACVGCPIAPFDTLADVARIYNLDLPQFLNAFQQTIAQTE
jgi:hybrid cluster-associated redox disulfide protein